MYYQELFKLIGYTDEEIEKEAPRIEKVFAKAELGPKECDQAIERLHKYFWMESAGVRKCWSIWMKQFLDVVLATEEHDKVIWYSYPLESKIAGALNVAGYYAHTPEFVNMFILGLMFGVIDPYFDLAEQNGMTPASGMCGVNKMRLSGFLKGLIDPMADLVIVSSFFCDNESKTDELISYHFPGVPKIYVDNSLDSNWGEYPSLYPHISDRRVSYLASELRNCLNELANHGFPITDEHIKTAGKELGKLWFSFQKVLDCMNEDPMPVSNNDMLLFYMLITNGEPRTLAEGLEAIDLLVVDAQNRVAKGEGVVPKGAPRVAQAMPWFSDPAINQMIEEVGLAPVACPFFWVSPDDMVKPKYNTYEERASETFMRAGLTHSTSGLYFRLKGCVEYFDLDGVLWNAMYSCRPVGGHPYMMKKMIEEEVGVPFLIVETDQMDSRDTPHEALRTRIETFTEMLKMRKAAKAA